VVGVALDQATKAIALHYLSGGRTISLIGDVLTFRLVRNPGAAFSAGEQFTVVFTILAAVAAAAIVIWGIPRINTRGWAIIAGFALAGVVGNLIDRIIREPAHFHGHVIDFIALKYFAVFNVADIFLTCVAVATIVYTLVEGKNEEKDGVSLVEDENAVEGAAETTTDDARTTVQGGRGGSADRATDAVSEEAAPGPRER
jgi:signal peptidase II